MLYVVTWIMRTTRQHSEKTRRNLSLTRIQLTLPGADLTARYISIVPPSSEDNSQKNEHRYLQSLTTPGQIDTFPNRSSNSASPPNSNAPLSSGSLIPFCKPFPSFSSCSDILAFLTFVLTLTDGVRHRYPPENYYLLSFSILRVPL